MRLSSEEPLDGAGRRQKPNHDGSACAVYREVLGLSLLSVRLVILALAMWMTAWPAHFGAGW